MLAPRVAVTREAEGLNGTSVTPDPPPLPLPRGRDAMRPAWRPSVRKRLSTPLWQATADSRPGLTRAGSSSARSSYLLFYPSPVLRPTGADSLSERLGLMLEPRGGGLRLNNPPGGRGADQPVTRVE